LFGWSRSQICIGVGPFRVRLVTDSSAFFRLLERFYAGAIESDLDETAFIDFHIDVSSQPGLRRLIRPQIRFQSDSTSPFQPFPPDHALPFFEWGLNWCIATQAQEYLMFHAAVLERTGRALLLPGVPGSGKSTLCAALAYRGWRLLSDEICLYRPETGEVTPIPRPIPLKNQSISVFRRFVPEAELGPTFPKTRKGAVAHVKPPVNSLERVGEPARPAWVVFPRYRERATALLQDTPKGLSFLKLANSSFNYELQGARGFKGTSDLIGSCATFSLEFDDLQEAVDQLEILAFDGATSRRA
jgi:HprK-related kinase A